jgi:membrane-associated phospholipid phosphatase
MLALSGVCSAGSAHAQRPSEYQLRIDPVADGATLVLSASLALSLSVLFARDTFSPEAPRDIRQLPRIDRRRGRSDRVAQGPVSHLAVLALLGLALGDAIAVHVLDRGEPWWTSLLLYAESATVTIALADLTKIAVRRPRPSAYIALREDGVPPEDTASSLSFLSGHSSLAASLSATAIYLTWQRGAPRPTRWAVLLGSTALTLTVAIRRVREAQHFPTDVIAGALVGACVGVLVPHMHRGQRRAVRVLPTAGRQQAGLVATGAW